MPEPKLTRQAFAAALKSGRGRALQYVRQYGLSEVGDLVLEACLKDQAYDPQCEGSRAAWLFAMFHGTEDESRFSAAILSTLSSLPQDADSFDLDQLCDLTALLARAGNDDAAAVLRSRVLNQSFDEDGFWYGFRPLIALDGVAAAIALVRRFGQHLLTDPSGWRLPSVDDFIEDIEDQGICEAAKEALQALAETDGDIKRYLDHQEERAREQKDQEENPAPGRQLLTLDGILESASREVDKYPGRYKVFGRHATADELKQVLQRLVEETREAVILRLLWVFRQAPLPDLPPRIWALANAKDEALRAAAIAALAHSRDSRVGELGRARLRSGAFTAKDYGTLDLLVRNYQASDAQLIVSALAPLVPDEGEAHSLAHSLLHIFRDNPTCTSLELLRWIYGFTPCTVCRGAAVRNMADLGILPPDIVAECVDDADEEVRQVVARY